jgi:uncharacterized membrane protein
MAEDTPSRELLENIVERLDHLERILQTQTMRLYAVERRLGIEPNARPLGIDAARREEPARPAPPQPTPNDAAHASQIPHNEGQRPTDAGASATGPRIPDPHVNGPRQSPPPRDTEWGGFTYETQRAESTNREAPPPPRPHRAPVKKRDIESVVGGSIFAWAGIIAGVFAVGFFLKLAFDNQWIGPGARVSIGALTGLALLVVGERLRSKGLRSYAFVLSGGGILILYLSIYASYNFYQLLEQPVAFLLMALVTTVAVLLSVRLDALAIAILGLIGGFLTPLLISTGRDNEVALFTYVALLDAGVLGVAYFKRWRSLDFLSFACTVLMTLGWAATFYRPDKLWTTLAFTSLFFVLYSLLAVFHNVLPRRRSRWFDLALLAWNATLYFGFSYLMFVDAGYERAAPASHALLLSAFFAALFYAARSRCREDRLLAYGYVGAAVTCFTAAVAIQLEMYWVTAVWAVEALALTWVGLRSGESAPRRYAFLVFIAAALHWLSFDTQTFALDAGQAFVPLLNPRARSCAVLITTLVAAAWLYRRARVVNEATEATEATEGAWGEHEAGRVRDSLGEEERVTAASALALAANGLAITLLSLDLSEYFDHQKAGAQGLASERAENARQFSLTALWSVYGASLVAYGVRRNFRALRYAGFVLLVVTTAKVLSFDMRFYAAVWHTPVLNQTFLAVAFVVAAYAFAARLYARSPELGEERAIVPVLTVAANLLMLIALSAEAAGYFDSGRAGAADAVRVRDLELAKQLSLSVIWALYGAGLLLAGGVWRVRLLRLMALVLLSLTTLKVFFWDLSSLDRVYRIVSFIVLGAILLAVSYIYQKSQQRAAADEESFDADAPPFDADTKEEAV